METTQLHTWSDLCSIPQPTADPYILNTAAPQWTVIAYDPNETRHQLISRILLECGARPRWVNDVIALQPVQSSGLSHLAIVALGARPSPGDRCLEAIQSLKRKKYKILCYEDGAESWSLRTRCLVLLAGVSYLLDSAALEFPHELRLSLTHLLHDETRQRTNEASIKGTMHQLGIVGESPTITTVFRRVLHVSPLSDLPILITGETGTGKELLARAIHQLDPKRRKGPFVALNCAAISPGLAESELFGHRRGAFTGADHDRKGLIRAAEGGVLLLDEIGELDGALQAKLLRVLQEHRVFGIGEDREVPVNVRIIAATHRDLREMVQQHRLRADLFHRLNVLPIHIPPLRERPTDLKPLIEHFVEKYQRLRPDRPPVMASDFIEAFTQLTLPGNARQLENLVRWVLVHKSDHTPLNLRDLPVDIWEELAHQRKEPALEPTPGHGETAAEPLVRDTQDHDIRAALTTLFDRHGGNLAQALEHCERLLFEAALRKTDGNRSQAARLLGITPRSVYNKIRKHQLQL